MTHRWPPALIAALALLSSGARAAEPMNSLTFDLLGAVLGATDGWLLAGAQFERELSPSGAVGFRGRFGHELGEDDSFGTVAVEGHFYPVDRPQAPKGVWVGPLVEVGGFSVSSEAPIGVMLAPGAGFGYNFIGGGGATLALAATVQYAMLDFGRRTWLAEKGTISDWVGSVSAAAGYSW